MSKIVFKYWTDMCLDLSGDITGKCTIEMNDDELKLFQIYTRAINDKAKNVIEYLKTLMPQSLLEDIDYVIYQDVVYNSTKIAIENHGLDCFEDMGYEEFNRLTMDELIERSIEDNCDGVYDYRVVKLEVVGPIAQHIITRSTSAKSKFVIDNSKHFSMARLVPEIVKIYLIDNPATTYAELKEIFHDDLIRKAHKHLGVLCTTEEYAQWNSTTKEERYHIIDGALVSGDGVKFYVNNQWSKDVFNKNVLPLLETIGYDIKALHNI